jgi:hypothetical protein
VDRVYLWEKASQNLFVAERERNKLTNVMDLVKKRKKMIWTSNKSHVKKKNDIGLQIKCNLTSGLKNKIQLSSF